MKTPLPLPKRLGSVVLLLLFLTSIFWDASAAAPGTPGPSSVPPPSSAAVSATAAAAMDPTTWRTVGLAIAAALAVGISVLGAGYAVARVGSAALGAAAERPELLIRSLLFVALAEGLAVLGFAIAMILAQKIGPV